MKKRIHVIDEQIDTVIKNLGLMSNMIALFQDDLHDILEDNKDQPNSVVANQIANSIKRICNPMFDSFMKN